MRVAKMACRNYSTTFSRTMKTNLHIWTSWVEEIYVFKCNFALEVFDRFAIFRARYGGYLKNKKIMNPRNSNTADGVYDCN